MATRKTTGSDTISSATSAPSDTGSGEASENPPVNEQTATVEGTENIESSDPATEQTTPAESEKYTVNLSGSVIGFVQVEANTPFSEVLSQLKVTAPDTYNYRLQDGKVITLGDKISSDISVKAEVTVAATPKTSRG